MPAPKTFQPRRSQPVQDFEKDANTGKAKPGGKGGNDKSTKSGLDEKAGRGETDTRGHNRDKGKQGQNRDKGGGKRGTWKGTGDWSQVDFKTVIKTIDKKAQSITRGKFWRGSFGSISPSGSPAGSTSGGSTDSKRRIQR